MPSLQPWELASIREDIENDLLPDSCNILTAAYLADNQGGFAPSWGTLTANVPCRLDVIRPREQIISDRNTHFTQFMLSVPYSTTINPTYRVEYGTVDYNVIGVAPNKSWSLIKRVIVEAI